MVAGAGFTLYRVVTVKRELRTFVAVDGGMGDNLQQGLFGQRFEAGWPIASMPRAGSSSQLWAGTAKAATS